MALKPSVDVVIGLTFGIAFLILGIRFITIGSVNSNSTNPWAQLVLTYTLGSTFGYSLGRAVRGSHSQVKVPGEFIILSALFLTLIAGFGAYAVYAVFYVKSYDILYSVGLLVFLMIPFAAVSHSETINKRNVKPLLELFSSKSSPAILGGYAATAVYDIGTGIIVAIVVGILTPTLPKIYRRAVKVWDERMGSGQ